MTLPLFLGAYWDARRCSAEDCIDCVSKFMEGLAAIDPLFGQWYERGRSRKEALTRLIDHHDRAALRALLLKGQNRYDEGGGVIDDLGYSLGSWNGAADEDDEASLNIHCGSYNERVGNSVTLAIPVGSTVPTTAKNAVALLKLVAETWQPRWAGIMSKQAMRERAFDASQPFVDWLVYVPRAIPATLNGGVTPIEGLGSIVTVQPAPPQGDDPDESQRIAQVEALIAG